MKKLRILQFLLLELIRVKFLTRNQTLLIREPEVPVLHVNLERQDSNDIGTLKSRVDLVIDQERGWRRELKVHSQLCVELMLHVFWRIVWEKFLSQEAIVHSEV